MYLTFMTRKPASIETSELRKRLRHAIEERRKATAARRQQLDAASAAFTELLESTATPLVQMLANVLQYVGPLALDDVEQRWKRLRDPDDLEPLVDRKEGQETFPRHQTVFRHDESNADDPEWYSDDASSPSADGVIEEGGLCRTWCGRRPTASPLPDASRTVVPLAPPDSGDPGRCRPIGCYEAARDLTD